MNEHQSTVHSKENWTTKMSTYQRMDKWIIFLMKYYMAEKINSSELPVSTWINLNTEFGEKKTT